MKTIVLDPGHGGADSGALGLCSKEKDVALSVCANVAHSIKSVRYEPCRVAWTHTGAGSKLKERCDLANTIRADCFVSIHCNSATDEFGGVDPMPKGFEVWTSPGDTDADDLAEWIFFIVKDEFPDLKMRVDYSDGDCDKEARFFVLVNTDMPAVLVEIGFISNPEEELRMLGENWQQRMGLAIARGITSWMV